MEFLIAPPLMVPINAIIAIALGGLYIIGIFSVSSYFSTYGQVCILGISKQMLLD
jgi:hypothetical protein